MNRRRQGHFVVEFVLSLGVWTALLVGFVSLERVLLVRLRVRRAARLGTFLQATGRVSEGVARAEVEDALLRSVGPLGSEWSIETGRYLDSASSRFYQLVKTRVQINVGGLPLPVDETVVCQQEKKT